MANWVGMTVKALVYTGILAGVAYCTVNARERGQEEKKVEAAAAARHEAEIAAARAVSTLPAGVQSRWEAYVDQRFDALLKRQGNTLRVGGAAASYVSANAPYHVDCDPFGIEVNFGDGEDQLGVAITPGIFNFTGPDDTVPQKAPELGVATDSIAAKRLGEALCERVALRMERLVASGADR
ncbi:MAG: hypothetical protein KKE02_14695 [Alphaproteobacteria bacterium]|nr:hypothetical protein [Alphaproteobacteria bacterium]MBU2361235.1 hypothetical protein [Alphaproteobacteria bacterium]